MTVSRLIERLRALEDKGYGDHQAVIDHPLVDREEWGAGTDWTTVEDARFRTVKRRNTGEPVNVVYLDWRC